MSQIDFISHLYCDDEWHLQSNSQHSTGVAELAAHFASEFGLYVSTSFFGLAIGYLYHRIINLVNLNAHRIIKAWAPTHF